MMRVTGNGGNTINRLKKSPTGRKLLAAAEKKGVKINFVANDGSKSLGNFNPNNNTITVKSNNIETMVETLGHELVHANTRGNGNSMKEETSAFIIGEKIAQEAGVNYKPHSNSFWANHVNKSYSGLASDNGILKDLNALDVNPFSTDGSGSSGSLGSSGSSGASRNTGSTGNISNANSSSPCSGSNCSNNFTDGSDSGNNSSFDPLNAMNSQNQNQDPLMQMLLMMIQRIMAMMGMQNNQQGNNGLNMANGLSNSNPFNAIPFQA